LTAAENPSERAQLRNRVGVTLRMARSPL